MKVASMLQEKGLKLSVFFSAIVVVVLYVNADDSVPTFNFKNKSTKLKLILTVDAKDSAVSKRMRIKKDDQVMYDGFYNPSQPIMLPPKHDISYYDLKNIDQMNIFYQEPAGASYDLVSVGTQYNFKKTNDKTTYYVKYCHYVKTPDDYKNPYFSNPCPTEVGFMNWMHPQEGIRKNLFGKLKTTDGYSLENNIKDKNYSSSKMKNDDPKLLSINFDEVEKKTKELVGNASWDKANVQ